LKDSTVYPAIFIAGHEPADGVLLPAHFDHDLLQRGAVGGLQHRDHPGCFAAFARSGALRAFRFLLGLGRLLCARGLLGRCTLGGLALGLLCARVAAGFGACGGDLWRQRDGFNPSLERDICQGPGGFRFHLLGLGYHLGLDHYGLGYRELGRDGFHFERFNLRLNGGRGRGLLSEALQRFPDALGRRLPVGELRDRLYASQAVPDLDQPLVIRPDQLGKRPCRFREPPCARRGR
jgi:hypothetical protein